MCVYVWLCVCVNWRRHKQALYAEMCEEFDDLRTCFDRFSSKVCVYAFMYVYLCVCVCDLHHTKVLNGEMCGEFDGLRTCFDRFSSKVCVCICVCM
jgi:hypothetical protein